MAEFIIHLSKDKGFYDQNPICIQGDAGTYAITFIIDRYQNEVDLSSLLWVSNVCNSSKNLFYLSVPVTEVSDAYVTLTWTLTSAVTTTPGEVFYTIEGRNASTSATVWKSALMRIIVGDSVDAASSLTPEEVDAMIAALNSAKTAIAIETAERVYDMLDDPSSTDWDVVTHEEVVDIRTGTDGTVYDTAGNAVRGQIEGLNTAIDTVEGEIVDVRSDIAAVEGDILNVASDLSGLAQTVAGNTNSITTLQTTVSEQGDAKVSKPVDDPNGNEGQLLSSLGDGTTLWINPDTSAKTEAAKLRVELASLANRTKSLEAADEDTESDIAALKTKDTTLNQKIETVDGRVDSLQSTHEADVRVLKNNIADTNAEVESLKAAVNAPYLASTVAMMTNTNRIYVYTGNERGYTSGNWYYYNGTAWVSGGVYNSTAFVTDDTLSISGAAADAAATGDMVDSISEETQNLFYPTDLEDGVTKSGLTFYKSADGSITINGTSTAVVAINIMGDTNLETRTVAAGTTLIFKRILVSGKNTGNPTFRYYDEDGNYSITLEEAKTFAKDSTPVLRISSGVSFTMAKYRFIIERGDTLHDYLPYGRIAMDWDARLDIEQLKETTNTLMSTTEGTWNKFYVTDPDAVSTTGFTVKTESDGSITLNGTRASALSIPIMGMTATDDYKIPAGTTIIYKRELLNDGDGIASTYPRLRYTYSGASGSLTISQEEPFLLENTSSLFLFIPAGASFNNANYRITVEYGETLHTTYVKNGQLSATDYYARDAIQDIINTEREETAKKNALDSLPGYYHTDNYIENRIATIQNLTETVGLNGDLFAWVTDMHLWRVDDSTAEVSRENGLQSVPLLQALIENTNIGKVFLGGDMLSGNLTAKATAIQLAGDVREYLEPIWSRTYAIVGNHEWNNPGTNGPNASNQLSNNFVHTLMRRDKEHEYGSISPYGDYWIDNAAQKIRYFFIGCQYNGGIAGTVNHWFAEELLKVPAEYTVMVLSHVGLDCRNWPDHQDEIIDPYVVSAITPVCNLLQAAVDKGSYKYGSVTYDYSNVDFTVAGILSGHIHRDIDANSTRGAANTYAFPIIATTCDRGTTDGRTLGTVTEQAFDVVHLDTTEKKIYMTRIGGSRLEEPDRIFAY